jgi:hypothetical protein
VTRNHRIGIFEIPPFPQDNDALEVVDVTARWSIDFTRDSSIYTFHGPIIRQYHDDNNNAQIYQCVVLTGRYLRVLKVSSSSCSVVSHLVPGYVPESGTAVAGARRMIWNARQTRQVIVTSTFDSLGNFRFGFIDSPFRDVVDLHFDEASGRICLLAREASLRRIVVMDVI